MECLRSILAARARSRPTRRAWVCLAGIVAGGLWSALVSGAGEFRLDLAKPTHDRWMYPFNFQPGVRPVAPTYGSFDYRFDTRDAQFLLGWDTASQLATNAEPWRILLRTVRLTLTSVAPIAPNKPFVYDPTHDAFETYLGIGNQPGAVPDSDPGRPIEVFGIGYRGAFDDATFLETSPYGALGSVTSGSVSIVTRNAYAAMYDATGALIDIANNVGQLNTNWTAAAFEVTPWAVGSISGVAPGDEVPDGSKMSFELRLDDPLILGHVQRALAAGRVRLAVSSLSPAGQSTPGGTGAGGAGAYPWWATKENLLYDPPRLEIEGVVVSDEDTDGDGLPDDWERFYFGNLTAVVSASADADGDGATNAEEWRAGTHPGVGGSALRIVAFGREADGRWRFEFPAAANRTYTLEGSTDLNSWSRLDGSLTYPSAGRARWVARDAGLGTGASFVRVRASTGPGR